MSSILQAQQHIVEGRRVEQCFYTRTQYGKCYHRQARCVTRFRDEHLGSSSTANGFSVIHSYLSKRSYPTRLCVTAFQLVHFQIAYHSSWWSYITQPCLWRWELEVLHLFYVLMSFKILFLVRFSHTLFLLGQHTLHNFHLLLTAIRVTNYNMMYGGPNLTRGASKC